MITRIKLFCMLLLRRFVRWQCRKVGLHGMDRQAIQLIAAQTAAMLGYDERSGLLADLRRRKTGKQYQAERRLRASLHRVWSALQVGAKDPALREVMASPRFKAPDRPKEAA